jgi:hypothetical protein
MTGDEAGVAIPIDKQRIMQLEVIVLPDRRLDLHLVSPSVESLQRAERVRSSSGRTAQRLSVPFPPRPGFFGENT